MKTKSWTLAHTATVTAFTAMAGIGTMINGWLGSTIGAIFSFLMIYVASFGDRMVVSACIIVLTVFSFVFLIKSGLLAGTIVCVAGLMALLYRLLRP